MRQTPAFALMRTFAAILMLTGAGPSATGGDAAAEQLRLQQWAEWRGPLRTGEAPHANPPTVWSETQNIRWKTGLPGTGHSSPVVWLDHIYVTTAEPYGPQLPPVPVTAPGAHDNADVTRRHRFVVLCVDRNTGTILWQQTVRDVLPHEGGHLTGSLASASPVTDGDRVYAWFGSYGLHALDRDGHTVWQHDVGVMHSKHAHGEGASPALHNGVLVINCDHEGQSFIQALRANDGEVLWTQQREEATSWCSPLIVEVDGTAQVIAAGTDRIRSYNLETGELIWECGGLSANVVATPVAADNILVAASSYDTRAMLAIGLRDARGDVTGTDQVLWQTDLRTPYVPSSLITGESVWFLRHYQGILSRRDLRSGEETGGPFRLGGIRDIYSSPVAAADRVYITDLEGRTLVFTSGTIPEQLALNQLDDLFAATPAVVGNQLIFRGRQFLYCIEDTAETRQP